MDEIIESENSVENFVMNMRNPNTVRKTTTDVNKAVRWLQSKYETRDLCDIPPGELNTYLAHLFYDCNQREWRPKSIQCSINLFFLG